MFWIGFCVGISAAFFIFAAFTWRITKERSSSTAAMVSYWERSIDNQGTQIAALENIEMSIRNRG